MPQSNAESKVKPQKKVRLNVECDELWSFVDCQENKQWVWLAMDRETREIIGVYIGARSEEGAKQLWNSLPPVYRQCAVCYTDFWAAYACIFPSKRHQPVGKDSGKTNHIERFNNTLRQRVSRLVRKTLSFSKKLENQIGAIAILNHSCRYVGAVPRVPALREIGQPRGDCPYKNYANDLGLLYLVFYPSLQLCFEPINI